MAGIVTLIYVGSIQEVNLTCRTFPWKNPARGRITEVLPALKTLFLPGTRPSRADKEAIRKFIATRKLSDCHISVHHGDGPERAYNSEDCKCSPTDYVSLSTCFYSTLCFFTPVEPVAVLLLPSPHQHRLILCYKISNHKYCG
jgi:hypothetical protein